MIEMCCRGQQDSVVKLTWHVAYDQCESIVHSIKFELQERPHFVELRGQMEQR